MKNIYFFTFIIISLFVFNVNSSKAQIYEPEGLNMPGAWNAWANPPVDHLFLGNPNQVDGGLLVKSSNGIARWKTTFHVAESGADLVGGSYEWLFTSGPSTNYFANKWSANTVSMNELQNYSYQGADNNQVTLTNNKWYTVVWEDLGYMDSRAIFMETSSEPTAIVSVTEPSDASANEIIDVNFTLQSNPNAEEHYYLQYTTDAWENINIIDANVTGTSGSVSIPGQAESSVVEYNVFSSTVSGITNDGFLYAMEINDNDGADFTYTVGVALPDTIGWANLQWPASGEILPGGDYIVYGQAFIYNVTNQADSLLELKSWVGYSTTDNDPSSWTNWLPAYYLGGVGENDEYSVNLGEVMNTQGTYYYATRFQYEDQEYEYGGYSESGGGFWDGSEYNSGVLTVTNDPTPAEITWANLQWPGSGEIAPTQEFLVYGQAYIEGITDQENPSDDLQVWIGYHTGNTDPSGWTNWVSASYFQAAGNNDEYVLDLGALMNTDGAYYYATRFQYLDQDYVYGGYSEDGGGFWNGAENVNGELTVNSSSVDEITWANLQWPGAGEIEVETEFLVYGQAYIEGITGQDEPSSDLEVWVGYHDDDTDPSTWTNWIAADYFQAVGDNDEYVLDLGALMDVEGEYYYATRFQYLDQAFVYGGYSEDGGGFWNGTENINGMLTVTEATPDVIGWANLQHPATGEIEPLNEFVVYGQAWIEGVSNQADSLIDLRAWVGYSLDDTEPQTWTNWIPAYYLGASGNNDEYSVDLGSLMTDEGVYYYATRFQYFDQEMVYGGYSATNGGFWDGVDNVSGILTVTNTPTPDTIGWANIQWPPQGEILPEEDFTVYGQAYIDGITSESDSLTELKAWIGISSDDSNPETWSEWIPAYYQGEDGDNDEYSANIGILMDEIGTYYYATRFQYQDQEIVFGGYSEEGGGFWDGASNVNGILTVTETPAPDSIGWANLQWPPDASIEPNSEFIIYGQAYIDGITQSEDSLVELQAWIGYSSDDTDPSSWTTWYPAYYLGNDGNNDEYSGNIGTYISDVGTYYYATRFQYQDQDFVYGGFSDSDGGFWDGINNVNGILTVTEELQAFPVNFNVIDATHLYNNIKLKGEMTAWETQAMTQDGENWSLTLDVFPGTYEWGVLEDDGSSNGIWLVIGDNLVVNVDSEGVVSGDTTYVITFVGTEALELQTQFYPNPVQDLLFIQSNSITPVDYQILNALGSLKASGILESSKSSIDCSSLESGIYFIKLNDSHNQASIKIIKQ
ncbi:T9SS type A sorting domain-containing protein [Lentimicrobium sp. S6]|uniref:T9SS type A sorting domain-containing protein n=1 Tax=Lentimicrobium sp. S6 TaxID=2735872 RepID=UPI0015561601|nr:T9SS type A sorting domain-containing protein [Lentimicrobium sp. S6]NPD46333.1 T9SS type A sorting domain-containing protein [Lentimicrobium sp. S6]